MKTKALEQVAAMATPEEVSALTFWFGQDWPIRVIHNMYNPTINNQTFEAINSSKAAAQAAFISLSVRILKRFNDESFKDVRELIYAEWNNL